MFPRDRYLTKVSFNRDIYRRKFASYALTKTIFDLRLIDLKCHDSESLKRSEDQDILKHCTAGNIRDSINRKTYLLQQVFESDVHNQIYI